MEFKEPISVGVIGLGQMGGSIALGLIGKSRVSFFARSQETREAGENSGIESVPTLKDLAECSDMLFVCVPVDQTVSVLAGLAPHLRPGQIVTDVGSTKERLVREAEAISWPSGVEFIGGHPMAGTDGQGFKCARKELFLERTWILTAKPKSSDSKRDALVSLITAVTSFLGARVAVMDPEVHDRSVAVISHIEHLVALALVDLVRGSRDAAMLSRLAAGSFMDATRVAKSSGSMVVPFLADNSYLSSIENEFSLELAKAAGTLSDVQALRKLWDAGADWRTQLEVAKPLKEQLKLVMDSQTVAKIMDINSAGRFIAGLEARDGQLLLDLA